MQITAEEVEVLDANAWLPPDVDDVDDAFLDDSGKEAAGAESVLKSATDPELEPEGPMKDNGSFEVDSADFKASSVSDALWAVLISLNGFCAPPLPKFATDVGFDGKCVGPFWKNYNNKLMWLGKIFGKFLNFSLKKFKSCESYTHLSIHLSIIVYFLIVFVPYGRT